MPMVRIIIPDNQLSGPVQLYLPVLQVHHPSQQPPYLNTHDIDRPLNWSVIEQLNVSTVWRISNFGEAEILYEMSQVFPRCLDDLILLGLARNLPHYSAKPHATSAGSSSSATHNQVFSFQLSDLIHSMLTTMQLPETCTGNVWSAEYLIQLMLLFFISQDCLVDVSMGTDFDHRADTSIHVKMTMQEVLDGGVYPLSPAIMQKSLDYISFDGLKALLRENEFVNITPVYERGTRSSLDKNNSKVTFNLESPHSFPWLTWNEKTGAFEGRVPFYSPLGRLERGELIPNLGLVGPYTVVNVICVEVIATVEECHSLSLLTLKRTARARLTFKVIPWYSDSNLAPDLFHPDQRELVRPRDVTSSRNARATGRGLYDKFSTLPASRRRRNRTSLYHDDVLHTQSTRSTLPYRLKETPQQPTPQTALTIRHYRLPTRHVHGTTSTDPSTSDTCNGDSQVSRDSIDWQSESSGETKRRKSLFEAGPEILAWTQSAQQWYLDESETNVKAEAVKLNGSDTLAAATDDHKPSSSKAISAQQHLMARPLPEPPKLGLAVSFAIGAEKADQGDHSGYNLEIDSASESCILNVGSQDADLRSNRRQASIWDTMWRKEVEQTMNKSLTQAANQAGPSTGGKDLGSCCADCAHLDHVTIEDGADTSSTGINGDVNQESGATDGVWQCLRREIYREPSRDPADSDATLGLQSNFSDGWEGGDDSEIDHHETNEELIDTGVKGDAPDLTVETHTVISDGQLAKASNLMASWNNGDENGHNEDDTTDTASSHMEDEDISYLVNFGW